jgi:hypothetical protein
MAAAGSRIAITQTRIFIPFSFDEMQSPADADGKPQAKV